MRLPDGLWRHHALSPALLGGYGVWEAATAPGSSLGGPRPVVATALLVACAALLGRRRWPLPTLLAVGATVLVPALLWATPELMSGVLAIVVAVFSCGRHASRPIGYLAVPLAMGLVTVASLRIGPGAPTDLLDSLGWSLNTVWIFAIGAALRGKQAQVDQAAAVALQRAQAALAQERLGVARDLHDLLAHSLAVIVVQAEAAGAVLDEDPGTARAALNQVSNVGRSALDEVRSVVAALREAPPAAQHTPDRAGSLDDLTVLVDRLRSSGLPVELHVFGDPGAVPPAVGQAAFRVVQEALTNVLRHAGQVPTEVSLLVDAAELVIDVRNAPGSGLALALSPGGGKGLMGMRERVEAASGVLSTGRATDGGFTVHTALPLQRPRS